MISRLYGHVGEPLQLKGTAYDFGHAVSAIQFSLDDGANWTTYETPDTNDYQNVTWTFEWTPDKAGFYIMKVRSVNDAGEASPEAAFVEIEVAEA